MIKRFVMIAGRAVPGLQLTAPETEQVTLASGKTIPASFAEVLTLRETNPVAPDGSPQETTKYLTVTRENLRFCPLRFNTVEGLDVENGSALSIEVLEARRAEDIAARQIARAQANAAPVVALD